MLTVTQHQIDLIQRLVKKIDRRLAFQAHHMPDGTIEVKLSQGVHKSETRLAAPALEASAEDTMQFEALRRQLKRVFDRMWVPPPPPKTPKVEIQRDLAFGFRPGGQRPGGQRGGRR
jgi:hypothetical protein